MSFKLSVDFQHVKQTVPNLRVVWICCEHPWFLATAFKVRKFKFREDCPDVEKSKMVRHQQKNHWAKMIQKCHFDF